MRVEQGTNPQRYMDFDYGDRTFLYDQNAPELQIIAKHGGVSDGNWRDRNGVYRPNCGCTWNGACPP